MRKHIIIGATLAATAALILTAHHRSGPASYYPPSSITGIVNPVVNQANIATTICTSGWTATIRPPSSYTSSLKREQMTTFKLKGWPTAYEEDHYISLELGGDPQNIKNLWPESYPEAHLKDQTENALHRAVCSGQLTLKQAQNIITSDWYAYYTQHIQGKFGGIDSGDSDDESGG